MAMRTHPAPAYRRPREVAHYLALSLAAFRAKLPALLDRGFPPPDPTTGNFDFESIERWRYAHNPQPLDLAPTARDAKSVMDERLERAESGWAP
jgi:hypothetical protein